MKSCFSRGLRWGIMLAVASPFFILTCCTSVNDKLGAGLIPENQRGVPGIIELGKTAGQEIKAYISYTDTVKTQNQASLFLGKAKGNYNSGITRTAMVMEFLPSMVRVDTTGNGFGFNVKIDSVIFESQMIRRLGDASVNQTFHIYKFKDPDYTIPTDTSHYMSYDWAEMVDQNKPLFKFDYKGGSEGKVESIKTTIEPEGLAFIEEMMSDTTWYWTTTNAPGGSEDKVTESRENFKEKFQGLIVAPAPGSTDEAAVYYSDIRYTNLVVHFHNYKTDNDTSVENIKDTVEMFYYFSDQSTGYTYLPLNNSIVCVEHDYTGTPFAALDPKMEEPIDAPGGKGHVQGICGFNTVLELPDAMFDALEALKEKETDDIFISQAILKIWMDNPNGEPETEVMNRAHERFGSYIKYTTWNPIADYAYLVEAGTSSTQGQRIPYNGYLNRSHGYYEFNITAYMHQAYHEDTPRKFVLGPTAFISVPNDALHWQETVLLMEDPAPDKPKQASITIKYIRVK